MLQTIYILICHSETSRQSPIRKHSICQQMYFNNLLPLIFNDWFTFVSVQHIYQTSSLTKEKLFKPPFKTISYGKNYVISSSIQSWNNAQQKLGSSKTLPSSKIKQLISYR